MFVLGLQGSPRKKGNTHFLLSAFMDQAERLGARTRVIDTERSHIVACKELTVCEKKGYCPIKDDMETEIYSLLREADVVIAATPVFFYNMSAQLKALVDRCQMFWARKYLFKLRDPGAPTRRGFLLSVGATRGKNLFEAIELSTQYFFDAVDAKYAGSLTYRGIESRGEMAAHKTVADDVSASAKELFGPFLNRRRVLFACRQNACRSQMASAFARHLAGHKIDACSAGSQPAKTVNPDMVGAMHQLGIDMAFARTRPLNEAVETFKPEIIVTMGCKEKCPIIPGVEIVDWDVVDPEGHSGETMTKVRDDIQKRVVKLAESV